MAKNLKELKREIEALDTPEKAEILRQLIADLDADEDENVAEAWLHEAQRRCKEIDDGVVEAVPAEEVFNRVYARLSK